MDCLINYADPTRTTSPLRTPSFFARTPKGSADPTLRNTGIDDDKGGKDSESMFTINGLDDDKGDKD